MKPYRAQWSASPRGLSAFAALLWVALSACSPKPDVSVVPGAISVAAGSVQKFSGVIGGMPDAWVTYSIQEGDAGGIIDETGVYTAPEIPGRYHVVATSVADPTRFAVASVTVTPRPPISVQVTPSTVSVPGGGSMQFFATVTGTSNAAVTWSVEELDGGRIDALGVYTAPPGGGTFHVRATSVADRTRHGRATVTSTAAVTGRRFIHYVTERGVESVPEDLRGTTIAAVVNDTPGNPREISAIGSADGTFYVPNVQPGLPFFLKLPGNRYIATSARSFDLSEYVIGRPEVAAAPEGTPLTVNVDGLAPWEPFVHELSITSVGAGLNGAFLVPHLPPLSQGATGVEASVDFNALIANRFGRGLLAPSDTVVVTQHTNQFVGGEIGEVYAATHALTTSGVRMSSGETGYVGGTLQPLALQPFNTMVNRQQFANAVGSVVPFYTGWTLVAGLAANAPTGEPQFRRLPGSSELLLAIIPGGGSQLPLSGNYGNPHTGSDESVFWYAQVSREYYARRPDGSYAQPTNGYGIIQAEEAFPSTGTGNLGVRISPPQSTSIDGYSLGYDFSTTSTPVLWWGWPNTGVPSEFQVVIHRLEVNAQDRSVRTHVATFSTAQQTLQIPRGILVPGAQYTFNIRALAGFRDLTQPNLTTLPFASADSLSGVVTIY